MCVRSHNINVISGYHVFLSSNVWGLFYNALSGFMGQHTLKGKKT
jgi:hypothetical protein